MKPRHSNQQLVRVPARIDPSGELRGYLRMAAVGDGLAGGSSTAWAPLLARAARRQHDVSFHSVARPRATAGWVILEQLADVLAHRPHVVVLAVGTYDVRSTAWDPDTFGREILTVGDALAGTGALLVLTRLAPLAGHPVRVGAANAALDALHERHGGVVVDLEHHPGARDAEFWSEPGSRLSELGQLALLHEAAALLSCHGLLVDTDSLEGPAGSGGARRDLRNGLGSSHHVSTMTTVTNYEQGRSATPLPFWPLGKVTPS